MKSTYLTLALALLAALAPPALAEEGPSTQFRDWFQASTTGRLTLPRAVEQRAREFRYVFVAGFASERMPAYFHQSRQALRAHGVPAHAIHAVFPGSHESVAGNGAEVRAQLIEIAARGPERMVVIAHSRGACDVLAFALENPGFVRDRVQALFLVQGPFGGTPVADYLLGQGAAIDSRMPCRLRALALLAARFEAYSLPETHRAGLRALTRADSARFWARMLTAHAKAIPIVGPRVFYVTSRIAPKRLRLFRRAIATYLQTYYGPNDGMVALADQTLAGVGTCLAVLDASHNDLTRRFPATRARRRARTALVRSILMTVARMEG